MATGGLYTLMANDGAQDKLLMATDLLKRRLRDITRLRCKHPGIRDPTPTLPDIERTHLLFVNAHFKPFVAIGYEYMKIAPQEGEVRLGSEITYSIPQYGDFFNDMVLNFRLVGLAANTPGNQVRYCDFLGHRLMQRVRFEVNGNFLDQYDSNVANFHYNYTVSPYKKLSWMRCVGQETPVQGLLTQNPGTDEFREVKWMVNGNQTPKAAHPDVELWCPLLFWFNQDVRLSIPSVSIPYGQRFVKVLLAPPELIAQGTPLPNFTPPTVLVADLYINNIFVNPEIHDIFIRRVGFSLIRVHRQQTTGITTDAGGVKLDQLKYPTETLYVGMRPTANLTSVEDWHRYYAVSDQLVPYPVAVPNPVSPPPSMLAFNDALFKVPTPTVDSIRIESHAIDIYRTTPASFFRNYIPLNYGNGLINSPEDPGMHMVTFNLFPGAYQPSGHLNLSRTREFYIYYTSSVASPTLPCELVVVAVALNFLLIADGSAALRYNT
jgi:hypothetical protein